MNAIVIVGGGHAGMQAAASLRDEGHTGPITLVTAEPHLPYHRPPLSKAFLKAPTEPPLLKPESFFTDNRIDVRLGARATEIDRSNQRLTLHDGTTLPYDRLIYAAGSRNRELPSLPTGLSNVFGLKTLDEARRLHDAVRNGARLTVIGGGFIGAEVAATARAFGCTVTVLEFAPRLMARACSETVSAHFLDRHRASGIDVRLDTGATGFDVKDDCVVGIQTTNGDTVATDVLLVCVGVVPNDEVAADAGLATNNGVVVDQHLLTADPNIVAIGDCTNFPFAPTGHNVRIESVQNATDQAKAVAKTLCGHATVYRDVPWFWSDQGAEKLQMVGLWPQADTQVLRGTPESGKFSVFHYVDETLAGVEAVNRPGDYMLARRLMTMGRSPEPSLVADEAADLKALLR